MKAKRILAWIAIILIPLAYIVSLILGIMDHPLAEGVLGITIVLTVVAPLIIYLLTAFPKHIAKIGVDVMDKTNKK